MWWALPLILCLFESSRTARRAQTRQRRLRNEHSQALLALLDANAQIPAPVPLLLDSQEEEEEELWARRALHAYHDALADGYKPGLRLLERLMSCLRLPHQATVLPSQHLVRLGAGPDKLAAGGCLATGWLSCRPCGRP